MLIKIKPLSVNDAWKGRRFRTDEYKAYQIHLAILLDPLEINFKARLRLEVVFGFSNRGSDIDNCLKPFIDCLQTSFQFNDNQIYELDVKKEIVKKGNEFINFELKEI